MQFLIGLGNPGKEYAQTRHNVGWLAIDRLAIALSAGAWLPQAKFKGEVATFDKGFLLKPSTFMNLSGQAARALIQYYDKTLVHQEQLTAVWVFHDDLDLALGTYKIQLGTGPKVHNGLLSLYQELGTTDFWHVRIGVDSRGGDRSMPGSAYVLQKIDNLTQHQLDETLARLIPDVVSRLQVE